MFASSIINKRQVLLGVASNGNLRVCDFPRSGTLFENSSGGNGRIIGNLSFQSWYSARLVGGHANVARVSYDIYDAGAFPESPLRLELQMLTTREDSQYGDGFSTFSFIVWSWPGPWDPEHFPKMKDFGPDSVPSDATFYSTTSAYGGIFYACVMQSTRDSLPLGDETNVARLISYHTADREDGANAYHHQPHSGQQTERILPHNESYLTWTSNIIPENDSSLVCFCTTGDQVFKKIRVNGTEADDVTCTFDVPPTFTYDDYNRRFQVIAPQNGELQMWLDVNNVYRSHDGGSSWTKTAVAPFGYYITTISISNFSYYNYPEYVGIVILRDDWSNDYIVGIRRDGVITSPIEYNGVGKITMFFQNRWFDESYRSTDLDPVTNVISFNDWNVNNGTFLGGDYTDITPWEY